jgi:hypothetical protein
MARIRSIKPEFWTNEKIVECSLSARLLFIGLWNFADDAGRLVDSPKTIKMQVFAGDDLTAQDVHELLTELSVNGLITRYTVGGKAYLQIDGWDHQKINRPVPSKIPAPSPSTQGALTEQTPPEGKGKEGKGKEGRGAALTELDVKTEPRDIVGLLERACEAAGMPPGRAVNEIGTGQQWANLDLSDDEIVEVIAGVANRPGYQPKRSLGYFTPMLLERQDQVRANRPNPELMQKSRDRMVGLFKTGTPWHPDLGPEPGKPGCLASPEVLRAHGFLDASQSAGNGRRSASAGVSATTPAGMPPKVSGGEMWGNAR